MGSIDERGLAAWLHENGRHRETILILHAEIERMLLALIQIQFHLSGDDLRPLDADKLVKKILSSLTFKSALNCCFISGIITFEQYQVVERFNKLRNKIAHSSAEDFVSDDEAVNSLKKMEPLMVKFISEAKSQVAKLREYNDKKEAELKEKESKL